MPDGLAERAWWARVHRAAERQGRAGSKVMSDWCHDMLRVLRAQPTERTELVDGHWQAPPAEHCTDEYKAAATRRLQDELGRALGVGPLPGP